MKMNAGFSKLIKYFPVASLPFLLEKGTEHQFGMTNDVLPAALFDELIGPNLAFEIDEFTEMLPGYHWRTAQEGYILVFWVARLLSYSFILFSYDKNGEWLDDAEIAGWFYENNEIVQRVANISDAHNIYIVEATLPDEKSLINPSSTSKWLIEIAEDGKFIQSEAND